MRALLLSLALGAGPLAGCATGIVTDPWDAQMRRAAAPATGAPAQRAPTAADVRAGPLLARATNPGTATDAAGAEQRVAALPARAAAPLTLRRSVLESTLAAGPQRFMAGVLLDPFFLEGRFLGFSLTRFYEGDPRFADVDLRRGDVVTRVNGLPIGRPHQFMQAWDSLRGVEEIRVEYLRGAEKRLLRVRVTPPAPRRGPAGSGPRDE